MLESLKTENLEYQKLSQDEQQRRGILGRLIGTVADFIAPTRNGRHYSEELWEKTFNDPIMKERIENGVCYGELGHPLDREETDIEKVAVCMSEVPKKSKDGKLTAVFDILDTPNGRILKTLCDYGSTLGVSSRGSGDTYMGRDGNEEVDPDSYTCQGFDIVLIPAVKSARLQYVTESLGASNRKSLRESLQDVVNNASDNDKKIMEETINNLNLTEANSEKLEIDPENGLQFKHCTSSHGEYDYYDLGYINHVDCSATFYYTWRTGSGFKEDFCTVNTHHPYDDSEYHYAESDEYATNWKIFLDGKKVGNFKSEPWDFISVAEHLIELDDEAAIKPRMVHESIDESLDVYDIENVLKRLKDYVDEYYEEHGSEWTDISEPSQIKDLERVINYLYVLQSEKPEFFESLEENSTSSFDIDEVSEDEAVVDNEAMLEELQTLLKQRQESEQKVIDLNEKLSVCYAKEEATNSKINSLKAQVEKLTEGSNQAAALKTKVCKLEEELQTKSQEIEKLNQRINTNVNARKALTEDMNDKKNTISKLNEELRVSSDKIKSLSEEVEDLKKDLQLNRSSYSKKLKKSNQLVENYKKITTNVVNRYIDSQALKLGISSNEIKNKLPESYNIDDIDAICEDLQSYKLNISKLPFSTMQSVKVTPKSINNDSLIPKGAADDFIDSQLLSLLEQK